MVIALLLRLLLFPTTVGEALTQLQEVRAILQAELITGQGVLVLTIRLLQVALLAQMALIQVVQEEGLYLDFGRVWQIVNP